MASQYRLVTKERYINFVVKAGRKKGAYKVNKKPNLVNIQTLGSCTVFNDEMVVVGVFADMSGAR